MGEVLTKEQVRTRYLARAVDADMYGSHESLRAKLAEAEKHLGEAGRLAHEQGQTIIDLKCRIVGLEKECDAASEGEKEGGMNEDLCNECESACRTCEAQQRDNVRLRAWLRRWHNGCNPNGLIVATVSEFDDALAGKAPPRKARKVKR